MSDTTKKEENYTEVGTIPVYKRAKNLLSISTHISDLTSGDKKVGNVASGLNGDIIVSLGEETYVVKVKDLISFLNNKG